jgi:hypothetical protein
VVNIFFKFLDETLKESINNFISQNLIDYKEDGNYHSSDNLLFKENINLRPFKEIYTKAKIILQQKVLMDKKEKDYFLEKIEQKEM